MANKAAGTDRQLQVAFQANVKVLEATGVLKQGGNVQVHVDNRRLDILAREEWTKRGQYAWRDAASRPRVVAGDDETTSSG